MTTTYDMNDTATLAHDPFVSEYGDGYGMAYGTGYDTDHGSSAAEGRACDDGRAVGGTYGGGYGAAGGYGTAPATGAGTGNPVTTSGESAGVGNAGGKDNEGNDLGKPSVGERVDTALDGMRSTFDNVVGTVKDKLADGGWERAEAKVGNDDGMGTTNATSGETITYNQIHDAVPDPAITTEGSFGDDTSYDSMDNVSQIRHSIRTAADGEDEI